MPTLLPIAALGAAGLAYDSLQGEVAKFTDVSEVHAEAAAVAESKPMPCGVPAIREPVLDTIASRWDVQRDSLIAAKGGVLFVPNLDLACRLVWCKLWLDTQEEAARLDDRLKAGNGPIGRARKRLKAVFFQVGAGDSATNFEVTRATSAMAIAMDTEIGVDVHAEDMSAAAFAGDMANNLKDGTGFAVESILAPVVGAGLSTAAAVIFSSLAPYLAVGGAIYYGRRKGLL